MLGRLADAKEEEVELRLLTEADYQIELDILTEELIDQYVEGKLPSTDHKAFQDYFLKSQVRQEKLSFALALKQRKSDLRRKKRLYRVYLPLVAAALLIGGLSVGIWRALHNQSNASEGLIALQSAYRDQRPLEPRITGFDYAPLLEERGAPRKIDYLQRDRAASLLLTAVANNPSAETHHALGKYYLSERQFDKAIDQFNTALKFDPENAQIQSDLGVALLENGKALDSVEPDSGGQELGRSQEHFNRALELDSSLLEARFNRALLYQYRKLQRSAEDDWLKYLQIDSTSKWADEAREHLRTLKDLQQETSQTEEHDLRDFLNSAETGNDEKAWAIVNRNYTSAGNTITNALLDSYLDLDSKDDDSAADAKLRALAYLSKLEIKRANDHYTSRLVRFYKQADPNRRRALILARTQMRRGYELFLASRISEALVYYSQAHQAFEKIGDTSEAIFAEYRLGHCYLHQPDLKRTDEIFTRLLSQSQRQNYRWLFSQILYRTASLRFTRNDYSESIDFAFRALKESEQIEDANGVLTALVLLADQYRALNNQTQSLEFVQRAVRLITPGATQPSQTWGVFTAIGLNYNALGLHRSALDYQKEALQLAFELNRPLIISRSYDYLALTYGQLARYNDALANIELAFNASARLSAERSGQEMMANSALHAGDIHRQFGAHDRAIESYDRSIRLYEDLDYPHFTYPGHKGKLLSYLATQNDAATEEEIRTVMKLFEQYRSKLTSENQRNTFFDVEQSIYDLSIDFAQSRKHDAARAFEYCELSRARSLLDEMRQATSVSDQENLSELQLSNTFDSLTVAEIRRRMPDEAQIIQYACLDSRLIIWVISRSNEGSEEVPLDCKTLSELVDKYLSGVNEPSVTKEAETRRSAENLYNILIKPVERLLDKTKLLSVVPDKALHYLPFGALISPETGRYLLEDFKLQRAPSSTVFIECSEQAAQKAGDIDERLLSVGDPAFDREAFPSLARLPGAGREAARVARFYLEPRVLLRDRAIEQGVRSAIAKANVVHLALHYVVDDHSNLHSKIVLAEPESGDACDRKARGAWQFLEIAQMKLPETRLVVLSACQTGIERQYRGEGALSVSRAFLIAGVPLVVASLWPVDSESTEKLMISFHQHRTRGRLPTTEALQQAQLEMIRSADSRHRQPYYWAAFTAIGGYAKY